MTLCWTSCTRTWLMMSWKALFRIMIIIMMIIIITIIIVVIVVVVILIIIVIIILQTIACQLKGFLAGVRDTEASLMCRDTCVNSANPL